MFAANSIFAQNSVKLIIKSLPDNHLIQYSIYAAGSFNGWNPNDENYRLNKDEKGTYFIELKLKPGTYEYKLTRGGWDKVECKQDGAGLENRLLKAEDNTTVEISVAGWQDRFPVKPKISSAGNNVCILDTAFFIPQLKRSRRIWIYLPKEYCDDTNKKFPVLYLQDGQNVFDDATAYSGEWGVDEFMDTTLARQSIVVAIDNGGNKRLSEYNPYDNDRFGKGEGDSYVDFIVKTLRPFINKNYRTLKEREHTYIAGSSMGGLISMYAILKYPAIFGGAGVFSPAFWITGDEIFQEIKEKGKKVKGTIFFACGKLEGDNMEHNMLRAVEEMAAVSKAEMKTIIRDEGKHDEATWRKEFPLFYFYVISGNGSK